jgi:hypothetical protein
VSKHLPDDLIGERLVREEVRNCRQYNLKGGKNDYAVSDTAGGAITLCRNIF